MKKLICIVLSLILVISSSTMVVSAKEPDRLTVNKTYSWLVDTKNETYTYKFTMSDSGLFDYSFGGTVYHKGTASDGTVISIPYGGYSLKIFNEKGDTVFTDSYSSAPGLNIVGLKTPAYLLGGTYILALDLSYGDFKFSATVDSSNENYKETYLHNNNSFSLADSINCELSENKKIYGTLGIDDEQDYYCFSLARDSYFDITLNSKYVLPLGMAENYIKPEIFNAAEGTVSPVSSKENIDSDTRIITQRYLLTSGKYYIKVSGWNNYVNPKYNFSAKNSCFNHSYKRTKYNSPTCIKSGKAVYSCAYCSSTATKTLAALGHTEKGIPKIAPTYFTAGKTAGKICAKCNKVLLSQKAVPKKALSTKKVTAGKKSFTVSWKKVSGASGYQVQYSAYKNMKSPKTITTKGGSKSSFKVQKLKKNKKYYVRVRAYKNKNKKRIYSSYSKVLSVKTK